jgi:hypothetical protein
MHVFLGLWDVGFWTVNLSLQAALAVVLWRLRHAQPFPAFAGFVYFSLFKSLVLVVISFVASARIYFYAYWAAQVFVLGFLFCVIHEVFMSITDRAKWLPRNARGAIIRMATASGAVLISASIQLTTDSRFPIMDAIIGLERGLALAAFCYMLALVMLTRLYGVPWYQRDAGIALGIVMAFSFEMIGPRVGFFLANDPNSQAYRLTVSICYSLASVIWLRSFATADPETVPDDGLVSPTFRVVQGGKRRQDSDRKLQGNSRN